MSYRNDVRLIWKHRALLQMLAVRDLQAKYRKYRLGFLWTLLEPLGMTVVIWFVFSVLLGTNRMGLQPYFLFLCVALLPWWWFTKGITATTRIFHKDNARLRVSLLPTQIWVVRSLFESMFEFLFALPVIVLAMIITTTMPSPLIILFPLAIAAQFVFMYGLALLIAAGSIVIPDLGRIVRILMRALFYLSPVLYAISNIPDRVQHLAALNPIVGMLSLYRVGLWPEEFEAPTGELISLGIGAVVVVLGLLAFRRQEGRILKGA